MELDEELRVRTLRKFADDDPLVDLVRPELCDSDLGEGVLV